MLVETDSPDQCIRRKHAPNEPANLIDVLKCAARLRADTHDIDIGEVAMWMRGDELSDRTAIRAAVGVGAVDHDDREVDTSSPSSRIEETNHDLAVALATAANAERAFAPMG